MQRAKQIFLQAIELPAAERAAFAGRECAGDAELSREVAALLDAHAGSDSFLEKPAAALAQTIDTAPSRGGDEQPGARIGPYKLLEKIGEGGMGSVWMAEQQQPVRRLVALKLIKTGMDSRTVLARFEAERQALALMDHPNIAKVLDAGSEDHRPYFVMELVKGTPITTFCDERRLPTRERLALFVQVCQAIQHAHQKGVIHRDIKPTNVLVALYDDRPVPKVIDFGVAKAAGQPLTERTLHTGFGAIIGTPEYMSPEQAMFNQLDVDTRSDVYSLGVLLYELLTGTTPVDRSQYEKVAVLEVLRVVREDEPPRPSVKLSTTDARASIAACRSTEPERLAREMRGELDWIVMKSLEKDRNRRYDTAANLGRDVERYLRDEYVEARPPSVLYRTRRFLSRHMTAVMVVALFAGLTLGWLATLVRNTYEMMDLLHQANVARLDAELAMHQAKMDEGAALDAAKAAAAAEKRTAGALARNEGLRLVLQSELVRPTDPGLALLLAIEGAERHPGLLANNALLAALAVSREERTLLGHTGPVAGLCYNRDGSRLVSASLDGSARLWDMETGRQIMLFDEDIVLTDKVDGSMVQTKFKPLYTSVCFSPDGGRILTTSPHGKFRLWDIATGKAVFMLETPEGRVPPPDFRPICPASFSPDGKWILTGCGSAKLWGAATGQPQRTLEGHDGRVNWAEFSADGSRIITAAADHTARIWNAETGETIHVLRGPKTLQREMELSRFGPDGTRAVTVSSSGGGGNDPLGRLWDAVTGKEIATLGSPHGMGEFAPLAKFSPDGRTLVTADHWNTGDLQTWNAATGKPLVKTAFGRQYALADFSPDSLRLASALSTTASLRSTDSLKTLASLRGPKGKLQAITYSVDGQRLAGSDGTGAIRIWTVGDDADRRLGRWPAPAEETAGPWRGFLAVSPDGRRFAGKTPDPTTIGIWDSQSGREICRIKSKNLKEVTYARFSPDGRRVIFDKRHYSGESLCIGDAATGELLATLPGDKDYFETVDLSPDGRWLVADNAMWGGRVYDVKAQKETASWKIDKGDWMPGGVRISPDGRTFLVGQVSGARLRDPATCAEIANLKPAIPPGTAFAARSAAFSPDGRRILTWYHQCSSGIAHVWEAASHKELVALKRADDDPVGIEVIAAEFSVDGAWVVMCLNDNTVRVWETSTGAARLVLKGLERFPAAASISPDKTRVVAAGSDKTVRIWDAATGEPLAVDHGFAQPVEVVRFLPEGRVLAVEANGSARVLPIDPLAAARARAPRRLTAEERRQYEISR